MRPADRFTSPLLDEYDVVPGFSDLEDSPEAPDYDIAHLYVSCIKQFTRTLILICGLRLLRFWPSWSRLTSRRISYPLVRFPLQGHDRGVQTLILLLQPRTSTRERSVKSRLPPSRWSGKARNGYVDNFLHHKTQLRLVLISPVPGQNG